MFRDSRPAALSSLQPWENPLRILCVRLGALGDLLMTGPAIRALKRRWPQANLTLLTTQSAAATATLLPEVDEIIVHEPAWMGGSPATERKFIDRLRRLKFDAAAIFTTHSESALPAAMMCFLAGIPARLAHSRENSDNLLTHWVPETEPEMGIRHEVRRQLDLVAAIGAGDGVSDTRLRVLVPREAEESCLERLASLGLDPARPLVVVHPGAGASARRWPAENFASLVKYLVNELNYQVVLTGTEPERELVEGIQLASGGRARSLVGELGVPEFAALLRVAPLLVSNNTGAVHLAAAVGTSVVDLYALTNPQHIPWGVPNRVLFADVPCKYCYKSVCPHEENRCLTLVPPERAVSAVQELLQGRE